MNPRHLEILQHALGLDRYGEGESHRNHFCAGGTDEPLCRELVAMGLMWTWEREWLPYYNCSVTDAGKAAVKEHSPAPPKLTRAQERYREFRRADTGRPFMEWLEDQSRWLEDQSGEG